MKKKEYIVPELTSVLIRAERGYATSGETVVDKLADNVNGAVNDFVLSEVNGNFELELSGLYTADGGVYAEGESGGMAAGYFTETSTNGWFN